MECSSAHLRYLLVIDRLSEEGGAVSSVEVARALGVKKPSVARMLETLQEKGLAEKERYGKIALTPAGAETARRYRRQLERLAAGFPGMGLCLTEPEALAAAGALLAALPPRYWEESYSATEEAPPGGRPLVFLGGG